MNYRLIEVDANFYKSCNHKDIIRMGLAERYGLKEIALAILCNELPLSRREIRDCIVYNGAQLCFSPSSSMVKSERHKKWLDTYFSVSENGIVFLLFNPDGDNKIYIVDEVS